MIAYTANETATLDYDVHRLRHKEFYAATECMDLDFFILSDGCIAQIHTDTSTASIETGTVERFATIDVLIATIAHTAADALTVFTNG